jgi:UDP-N-acetylglucosamine:LPS N-acetylglucosamine transferase
MKQRLMLLLGEGGHSKEMLRLAELLQADSSAADHGGRTFSYVLVQDDEVSAGKLTIPGNIDRVLRPRDKTHNAPLDAFKTLICALQALVILVRRRPHAILTTGPSVAVPVCAVGKLLRCKIIFIETGSRIHALSTTGRIIYRFADLFLVQWEELLLSCPRAIYAGRLW